LLRVLSDGHFYRVGGHSAVKTNVRVIAATHQDLEQRVKEGVFREDLFHRLNVIRLRLPALRERREDIPMLTRHFLRASALQLGVEPKRIADPALARLSQFAFPGNVRQLENICHWLTVMAPAQVIEAKDLPPEVLALADKAMTTTAAVLAPESVLDHAGPAASTAPDLPHATELQASPAMSDGPAVPVATEVHASAAWELDMAVSAQALLDAGRTDVWDVLTKQFESRLIRVALVHTKGRRIEAAHKLGIGRNTITRKIQELGID
jgi:two-component system nitrogen regulation response regulator GlnG